MKDVTEWACYPDMVALVGEKEAKESLEDVYSYGVYLEETGREDEMLLDETCKYLDETFIWMETPQGSKYWGKLYWRQIELPSNVDEAESREL
jgi:hypothetical protein